MSTKDVFEYFQDYMPGSIEWIDDISCKSNHVPLHLFSKKLFVQIEFKWTYHYIGVVVWEDENSTKRAFANLGTKFTPAEDSGVCMFQFAFFLL